MLFANGESGFAYPFKYIYSVSEAAGMSEYSEISILVSVPKRNHKRAVKRNKVRRRTKEAFRLNKKGITDCLSLHKKHLDIAFIYVSKEIEQYKTIENAIGKILEQIAQNI